MTSLDLLWPVKIINTHVQERVVPDNFSPIDSSFRVRSRYTEGTAGVFRLGKLVRGVNGSLALQLRSNLEAGAVTNELGLNASGRRTGECMSDSQHLLVYGLVGIQMITACPDPEPILISEACTVPAETGMTVLMSKLLQLPPPMTPSDIVSTTAPTETPG